MQVDAQQEARLQGLGQLFNVVTDSTLQYHVLLELLKFSAPAHLPFTTALPLNLICSLRPMIPYQWTAEVHSGCQNRSPISKVCALRPVQAMMAFHRPFGVTG